MSIDPGGGRRHRSPGVAAFLSFLWPGLGQWYGGARRTAVVFALPILVVAIVLVSEFLQGPETLVLQLLSPGTALTVAVLIVLLGLWRIVAMVDGLVSLGGRLSWRRPSLAAPFATLIVVVLVSHLAAANLAWSFYQAGSKIFTTGPDATATLVPTSSEDGNGAVLPIATPIATPQTAESRINILIVGIDSSEIRNHALTDTMLVVSVDPTTHTAAMVSFPRDIADFPLWSGGIYHGKINALMTDAEKHPKRFPDGGITTLTKELGYLLGITIHFYAAVNLDGFEAMIDEVGGVTITNNSQIDDPSYGGWKQPGRIGFQLSPGKHTLDGETALAYVRSRKGAGNNDFERARRQQQLLVALEHKLADPTMLPKLPRLLDDATRTITTSFPSDRLADMLSLGRSIDDGSIKRAVLGPPYALRDPAAADYRLVIVPAKLSALSISLFGTDSRYAAAGSAPAP
jgi:polyisoprenyl-teichoic acid--peptidoglycan teichoic acid transferase